jgi:hypothetical protein
MSGYEEGDKFLGLAVGQVGTDSDIDTINTDIPSQVQSFAKKHNLTPRLFLVQSCG